MTQTPTLDRNAVKLAKDPRVVRKVAESLANLRAGNSVDAIRALREVRQERAKAKAKFAS